LRNWGKGIPPVERVWRNREEGYPAGGMERSRGLAGREGRIFRGETGMEGPGGRVLAGRMERSRSILRNWRKGMPPVEREEAGDHAGPGEAA